MTRLERRRLRRLRAGRRALALGAAGAILLVAGGAPGSVFRPARLAGSQATGADLGSPRPVMSVSSAEQATIAKLMVPTVALSAPAGPHVVARLDTAVRPGGGPTDLLVLGSRQAAGRKWLHVLLPIRPNETTGWIDADMASTRSTPWRIVVSTEARTVQVLRLGVSVRTFSAVVGAARSPTPHGLFAVMERIPLADPSAFYGSWIVTLTAHSTVYRSFQGGDGRVAIHGRGGSSLAGPLGSALSAGCVRLDNTAVDWLARVARPGTPVVVA